MPEKYFNLSDFKFRVNTVYKLLNAFMEKYEFLIENWKSIFAKIMIFKTTEFSKTIQRLVEIVDINHFREALIFIKFVKKITS